MEPVFVVPLFLSVFSALVTGELRFGSYDKMTNTRFASAYKSGTTPSAIVCCESCKREPSCDLVAYNKVTGVCELSQLDPGDEKHIGPEVGWDIYYDTANECDSNPCKNSAVCQDGIGYYTCTCTAQWEGTNCDVDINECNHATDNCDQICLNIAGGFNCACIAGYALTGNGWSCVEVCG